MKLAFDHSSAAEGGTARSHETAGSTRARASRSKAHAAEGGPRPRDAVGGQRPHEGEGAPRARESEGSPRPRAVARPRGRIERDPTPRFAPPEPVVLPTDVKLMNAAAVALVAAAVVIGLAAGGLWLAHRPFFAIQHVRLQGDLTRNNAMTLRAATMPQISGDFFTLDLNQARRAFEAVPWVRHAVVRRVWPDRLVVSLEEHRPAALWVSGDDDSGNDRLINSFGEVFDANLGDVEDDELPELSGPEGSSAQMLSMYRRLLPLFKPLEETPVRLVLSGRGSWQVELDSGTVVEMGRGSEDEVVARGERYVRTVAEVTGRMHRAVAHADLRHRDGYALQLKAMPAAAAESGSEGPPASGAKN